MCLTNLPRIAVLASGRGSNFEAIAKAIEAGQLAAQICVVASDKKDAGVLDKARARGLSTLVEKDQTILADALQVQGAEFVVLAGYMKILKDSFIQKFWDDRGFSRIVNIHPSLLPAFPGLHSYRQAFDSGAKETGVTVHFVDAGVDTGPICAQQSFPIADCSTPEEVESRGLKIEHQLYPQTLKWILANKFEVKIREGRIYVQPH
jgi:phosphoribosylglycinamide formyltransferase-1